MILSLINEDGETEFFELHEFPILVGRAPECHVLINSDNISRKHLEIQKRDDQLYIRDMTVSNWVSYNGERLAKEKFVEYFYFSKLLLPDGYQLSLSLDEKEEREAILKAKSEKVDLYYNPVKSREPRKIKKQSVKSKDTSRLLVLPIVLFVLVAGYFYYQNYFKAEVYETPINEQNLLKKVVKDKEIDFVFLGKMQRKIHKCRQPSVREFCQILILNRLGYEGVVEFQKQLFIFKELGRRVSLYEQEVTDIKTRINFSSDAGQRVLALKNTLSLLNISKIRDKKINTVFINLYDEKNPSLGIISTYKLNIEELEVLTDKALARAFNDLHIGAGTDVFEAYVFPLLEKIEDE